MSQIARFSCSLSLFALVLAAPAQAEVSAADLWAEWQATAAATGQQMTADVTETETGLILSGFTTMMEQDGVTNTGSLAQITMTERPDGTVDIALSDTYTITASFPEYEGGPLVTLTLDMTHEGLEIIASGEVDSRAYDYAADAIAFTLRDVQSSDTPPEIDLNMVARDLVSAYRLDGADPATQRFTSSGTIAAIEAVMEVTPPEDIDGALKVSFSMGGLTSEAEGALGALAMAGQAGATGALPEGFDISGSVDYDRFMFEMAFDDGGDSFDMTYANAGGRLATAISDQEISYDIAARDMRTHISGSDIPFPIDIAAGESELALTTPLAASDAPRDAALRLAYRDLSMAEAMWSMFDPAGQVPRDPATVILDATAQLRLFVDLMSPDAMEMETPPGELRALALNELQISIGGAELTGSGDMTFAEGQMVPMPVGNVDLALSGGNGLLDRLVGAGLVPNEQAAMARGVTAMFSRPGALPDTLETTIEFQEGGMITANGVPLQ